MESNSFSEGIRGLHACKGRVAFACGLLSLSFSAFGATSLSVDCDGSGKNPRSQNAPVKELSVSVVDLSDAESSIGLESPVGVAAKSDEAIAPLLYLAPRVASILNDVFNEHGKDSKSLTSTPIANPAPSSSPVADSAGELEDPAPTRADDTLEAQPSLMRIQREMYRTDI